METIIELYKLWSGVAPAAVEKLPGAGSNRVYYRLGNARRETVIGCVGTSKEENHAFITLARHFKAKGLPVPEVFAVSDDEFCYLQQDLGGTLLFDALRKGREVGGNYNEEERQLLRQVMRLLPRVQFDGADGLDFSVCYPQPEFDETNVMFDLNYFKYCFLKPTGLDFHEMRLEYDFRQLAKDLTKEQGTAFLYRDFQARNIMLSPLDGSLFLIDFQGGRRGPVYYDLASFLWQASARYPDELRNELIDIYYAESQKYTNLPSREDFNQQLRLFVLFRLMQVLGAYGYRGYFERKPHFIQSIPPAIKSLKEQLADMGENYPCLMDVLRRMVEGKYVATDKSLTSYPSPLTSKLVVRIFSFSYKKGIPQDESGNGGGYVFDCRGTHNPGRYEEYKHLTGLDDAVKKFLEDDGEILRFLDHIYQLADAHVQRYVERGFTSLMFSFGCTGGQHRSVYSAQHLAEHIHQRFPEVVVRLCHREQGISSVLGE